MDLALPGAGSSTTRLFRDLARLAPFGTGNPEPLVASLGLTVQRVRAANGGHTQLVLRRERDVLDGIAFGRPDLAEGLAEGDRVDVVARLASRTFGGLETLQLEVRDVSASGTHPRAAEVLARAAGGAGATPVPSMRPRPPAEEPHDHRRATAPKPEPPRRPARDPYGLLPTGMPIAAVVSIVGLLVIAIVTLSLPTASCRSRRRAGGNGRPRATDQVPTRTPTPSNVVIVPSRSRASRSRGRWSTRRTATSGSRAATQATQLTSSGNDSMPSFSPDGKSVYFVRTRKARRQVEHRRRRSRTTRSTCPR